MEMYKAINEETCSIMGKAADIYIAGNGKQKNTEDNPTKKIKKSGE